MKTTKKIFLICGALPFIGCAASRPPLKTVEKVDIQRFMGDWYVIAAIPLPPEKKAYNAVENYKLDSDGTIDTTFTFNKGALDGPKKTFKSRGFVVDKVNNSTWKIQFLWPFKAEYLITHLNDEYTQTIVSRTKRDYVWLMARTPQIPDADYQRLLEEIKNQGYDLSKIRKVPQQTRP